MDDIMSDDCTREFGVHIQLNHTQCVCKDHTKRYYKEVQKTQNNNLLKTSKLVFPASYSLSKRYPLPIVDQLSLGACVANSYASIIQSLYNKFPSRLYLYFNGRVGTQNSVTEDTGLDLLQSMPIFTSFGIVAEDNWKYNISKFTVMPPYSTTYRIADTYKPVVTKAIPQTNDDIKTALLAGKFVIFGFFVFPSFMTNNVASTGICPVPSPNETTIGGHCMHIVGWCKYNNMDYYICRNSWGKVWGNDGNTNPTSKFKNNGINGGFVHIPSSYILNPTLAFEFLSVGKQ